MKIITALENPKTNEKLKKYTNFEILGNDIQYQEGIIEILEQNPDIDLIIISELLTGQIGFKKLIEKIKIMNKNIEIIVILKNENEETKNYLISKGIFNIFYNNKITNDELINKINNINSCLKENEINEEIKSLKKIILEKNNEIKSTIYKKTVKEKYLKIKSSILEKLKNKANTNNLKTIISIVGTNGVGKSIFCSLLAKIIKNKKILLIDFDIFNQSINSIFNVKKNKKNSLDNINELIIKESKNIDLLCATKILFDEKYKIEKDKIRNFLKNLLAKYDWIIIDTTSECFFDYTKNILHESDKIVFLIEANLVELKKSKNLLDIYINKWKINKQKISVLFNKVNSNSIDSDILKTLFSDFNIIGKIKSNDKFNSIINNNLKIIDKKVKKQFEKIIEKCKL